MNVDDNNVALKYNRKLKEKYEKGFRSNSLVESKKIEDQNSKIYSTNLGSVKIISNFKSDNFDNLQNNKKRSYNNLISSDCESMLNYFIF